MSVNKGGNTRRLIALVLFIIIKRTGVFLFYKKFCPQRTEGRKRNENL
ncbi:hypothetical protein BLAHAN_04893 [Blautia hansenii DSM 20583]|uniref:Uncharacterized protein n=1 Tax=Blautia hansenii DSM 20583 TaxID=537007 RepID=C9L686_BLAHA|nr:hypothetical protein BLAHAN_04893 [Blautia hansenii DSM 20583]